MFKIGKLILQIILNAILSLLTDLVAGIVDFFSKLLDNVFIVAEKMITGDFVGKVTNYCLKLGIALLVLISISQIIKSYILYEDGEGENDISGFLIRLGKTAILMTFSTAICNIIITVSQLVGKDMLSVLSGKIATTDILSKELSLLTGVPFGKGVITLFFLLVVIVCLIIISVQAGLRGVNLAVLQMTAPLFAVNYVTTDKGLWKKWVQNILSVAFTYVVQISLTNIAMKYIGMGITNDIINTLLGLCWLIVTIQSPRLLKEFAYSSGVGNGVSRSSSQVMMAVSRFIK